MKKTSKALLLSLCAVVLVTASVLGTMAYLTSTDEVVNTFTVGNVAIDLDEKDVDHDTNQGDNVVVDGETRDKANSYKLLPGGTYEKDPIVHVAAGSENCYLFVKVNNEIADIEGTNTVASQMTANGWTPVPGQSGVYIYTQSGSPAVVTAGTDVPVFKSFTINGEVTGEKLAAYENKQITVTAYAIQADGFEEKSAEVIWNAVADNR